MKTPRIGVYQPWSGNIDEGWTRWILEQFHFPFTVLHNPDIRDGHLRDRLRLHRDRGKAARQIMDGARRARCRGSTPGGIGENGAQALRDFVTAGGTLVTLGNAALFAIEQFNLPVTNVVAGLRQDQFFCSGSLLRAEIKEPNHPVVAGLPPGPARDVRTQSGVRDQARISRQSAGQLPQGPQSAGERLPAGRSPHRRQGRGARRQLRHGPHHHAGLPAAVARAVARHLQIPVQRALLQPVDGARSGSGRAAADAAAAAIRSRPPGGAKPRR